MAYYGEKKIIHGYLNGKKVIFAYSSIGVGEGNATLADLRSVSLADLNSKLLFSI